MSGEEFGQNPLVAFSNYAKSRGFVIKIVGDYAYKRSQRHDSPILKLRSSRDGKLQLSEIRKGGIKKFEIDQNK